MKNSDIHSIKAMLCGLMGFAAADLGVHIAIQWMFAISCGMHVWLAIAYTWREGKRS